MFDKVVVLYEGRQIFFGHTGEAKAYFESLGFICPSRQTTADFLTSMSSPSERVVAPGYELKVPRTPDEFSSAWRRSSHRRDLIRDIETYLQSHPFDSEDSVQYSTSRKAEQAKLQRTRSPYTLNYFQQMKLNLWRCWQAFKGDYDVTLIQLSSNIFEALVVGSIFYNLGPDTSDLSRRAVVHFFIIMMNALASVLEILTLYTKRKIVEKHSRYALYHPSAEALASAAFDLPYKIVNSVIMNTLLYFMCNLRREPGAFFFFFLINFSTTMSMSMLFRLIGSLTKTLAESLAPASIILLAVALFSGFPIPQAYMLGWSSWLHRINPVYYAFESIMINEFHGREFPCADFVPSGGAYQGITADERVCSAIGSTPGSPVVQGNAHIQSSYGFSHEHKWRNFGLLLVFIVGLLMAHLIASELVTSERSKGEILVYLRDKDARAARKQLNADDESGSPTPPRTGAISGTFDAKTAQPSKQTSVFHWENVCFDVKIKTETRRILNHVDGWVKPGTLTALMVRSSLPIVWKS
jgi:ATP-binding cassette subfamily G (WHITE) protein 2 (PDR)